MIHNEAKFFSKARSLFSFSSKIKPEKWGNSYFYPFGVFNEDEQNYLEDFLTVPELNAIINLRARAKTSWILTLESKTTGKEVAANESLVRILRSPNWFQGQGELFRQSSIYHDIYGNEYLYFLTPVGMPNTYKGLYTIDPSLITIEYKNKNKYFNDPIGEDIKYTYENQGYTTELDKTNLIHLNDNRVEKEYLIKGTSKLKPLHSAIENIKAAYRKRNIALTMPVGVLRNNGTDAVGQAIPMDKEEKEKALRSLKSRASLPILTNLPVSYDAMNVNAQQMGLFEETREDTARICDAFGVPYELLASQKGTTFTNLKEAKKQFYEETIIPEANELIDALNKKLGTDNKSWHVVARYNHLPIFQEDQRQRAVSLNQMSKSLIELVNSGLITREQAQEELKKFGL